MGVAVAVLLAECGGDGGEPDCRGSARALRIASGIVAVVGVLTATWVIRPGHEGARVTWQGVLG